jgi:hypothetical protein
LVRALPDGLVLEPPAHRASLGQAARKSPNRKLADRSPLLRLASEKLTPGAGAPRHSSVDPVALRDQGDACSIIINFGGCVVATAEQLRVWAAEARTWAEQATSREMAAAMHRLAVDLYELAHVQAPDAVTDSPDSPR